jgi:uncharacterized protein (DUF736 family)
MTCSQGVTWLWPASQVNPMIAAHRSMPTTPVTASPMADLAGVAVARPTGRNGSGRLSSPDLRSLLANQESRPAPSSALLRAGAAASIVPGLAIAIEAAMGAVRKTRNCIMATIGHFTKTGDELKGSIITLSVQAKNVRMVPETTSTSDKAPSHRLTVGEADIGAAWKNPGNGDKRPSYKVKLDDPSFAAPIYATLIEREDGAYDLIWSRPTKRRDD